MFFFVVENQLICRIWPQEPILPSSPIMERSRQMSTRSKSS